MLRSQSVTVEVSWPGNGLSVQESAKFGNTGGLSARATPTSRLGRPDKGGL